MPRVTPARPDRRNDRAYRRGDAARCGEGALSLRSVVYAVETRERHASSLSLAQGWSLDGIAEDWLADITSIRGRRVTYANREVRAACAPPLDLRASRVYPRTLPSDCFTYLTLWLRWWLQSVHAPAHECHHLSVLRVPPCLPILLPRVRTRARRMPWRCAAARARIRGTSQSRRASCSGTRSRLKLPSQTGRTGATSTACACVPTVPALPRPHVRTVPIRRRRQGVACAQIASITVCT